MGPEGYKAIQSALKGAQLGVFSVRVKPKATTEEESVRFVTIQYNKHIVHARTLNAIDKYVTLDADGPDQTTPSDQVLLKPVDISRDGITFEDVHYPDSK